MTFRRRVRLDPGQVRDIRGGPGLALGGGLGGIVILVAILLLGGDPSTVAPVLENLTVGMGTAALTAFLAALTNRQFTAMQFALLSTLATLPRSLLSAPSGFLAEALGWPQFFVVCTLLALPGLLLLPVVRAWFGSAPASNSAAAGSALQSSQS